MFLEGDRTFDMLWGAASGAISLALAVPLLWWYLPAHRRSVFGTAIDPNYRLQLAYGLLGMGMFGTNLLCRFIPHGFLEYVHPTFAFITFAMLLGLGPRIVFLVRQSRRRPHPMRAS
ncbi:MAG: hypothetical protein ABSB70_04620 [Candidatus Velthaea sp.]